MKRYIFITILLTLSLSFSCFATSWEQLPNGQQFSQRLRDIENDIKDFYGYKYYQEGYKPIAFTNDIGFSAQEYPWDTNKTMLKIRLNTKLIWNNEQECSQCTNELYQFLRWKGYTNDLASVTVYYIGGTEAKLAWFGNLAFMLDGYSDNVIGDNIMNTPYGFLQPLDRWILNGIPKPENAPD